MSYKITSYDSFDFPIAEYDLAAAMFSLPFNPPATFDVVFQRIIKSLKPGGIFCGQFFGVHDEWNTAESGMTFHTKDQVEKLLEGTEMVFFKEDEKDGTTANGTPKHWHVFHVIARKK